MGNPFDTSHGGAEIERLIDSLIEPSPSQPFGTYVFGPDELASEIARELERRVFLEAFGNTSELLSQEYDRFDTASFFTCVIDHRRKRCAAMMRIIVPKHSGPGLKSLLDFEKVWGREPDELSCDADVGANFQSECCWDVATIAVASEYRTAASLGMMHVGLYQVIGRLGQRFNVEWLVAIFDYAVFRLLRMQLGPVFSSLGEPMPYLGSARSVPAICHLPEAKRYFKKNDPPLYKLLYSKSAMGAALREIEVAPAVRKIRRLMNQDQPELV